MLRQEIIQPDRVLDALGDPTRREILRLLRSGPLPVGSIAAGLPISRPAVSKQLRILQAAGLVAYNEQGTRNVFYLKTSGFQAARRYLEQFWEEALLNFQSLAEAEPPNNPVLSAEFASSDANSTPPNVLEQAYDQTPTRQP